MRSMRGVLVYIEGFGALFYVSISKEKVLRWSFCNIIDAHRDVCHQTYSNKFWGVLLTYAQGSKGAMCCSIEGEQVRLPFGEDSVVRVS